MLRNFLANLVEAWWCSIQESILLKWGPSFLSCFKATIILRTFYSREYKTIGSSIAVLRLAKIIEIVSAILFFSHKHWNTHRNISILNEFPMVNRIAPKSFHINHRQRRMCVDGKCMHPASRIRKFRRQSRRLRRQKCVHLRPAVLNFTQ